MANLEKRQVFRISEKTKFGGYWREVDHSYAGETYVPEYYDYIKYYCIEGGRKHFHTLDELRKYYKNKYELLKCKYIKR